MSLILPLGRHEGRTWYSSHRGRLWIAATLTVPTSHEIQDAEHMFENLKEGELISLFSETV
jgi:hypothetical protein